MFPRLKLIFLLPLLVKKCSLQRQVHVHSLHLQSPHILILDLCLFLLFHLLVLILRMRYQRVHFLGVLLRTVLGKERIFEVDAGLLLDLAVDLDVGRH